ncbi:hypothetical protein [Antarctobacter sp.]|uniref:hypothetical protein n=1 Tax=Antarctobacter sp. TaxID=1872577 RepID=UPI003A9375FD
MELTQKIRFSTVAQAIDLTPKAFRNWLQRYELHLVSDHKTKGWTDFALADVAVLALTREMVRWGVGVEAANKHAYDYLVLCAGPLFQYRSAPPEALLALLDGRQFCVAYRPGTEDLYLFAEPLRQEQPVTQTDFEAALWVTPMLVVSDAFDRIPGHRERRADR